MRGSSAWSGLLVAATVLLACIPASGQPDLREQARRHFQQGVAFSEAGDHEAALSEFEEAQRLRPHPRILRNIAATQEALRRYLDAIATLERVVADPVTTAAERREAETHLRGLRPLLARIQILADPAGAEVVVDDRVVGTVPLAEPVSVASGQVHILVRSPGYRPEERNVRVAAGAVTREEFRLVALRARLHLESNAEGARARVGDRPARPLPLDLELPPGTYAVRTEAPAFLPDAAEIVLQPDEDRTLTVVLERPPATLQVDVGPATAQLLVDGERRAGAGRHELQVDGGPHRVRIEGPGLVPWEDEVRLEHGARHALRARLGRDRIWVRPAWFWGSTVVTTGLAAVAVVAGIRVLLLDGQLHHLGELDSLDARNIHEERDSMADVTNALWVGAVAAGVTATLLYLLSRGEPPEPQVRVR